MRGDQKEREIGKQKLWWFGEELKKKEKRDFFKSHIDILRGFEPATFRNQRPTCHNC